MKLLLFCVESNKQKQTDWMYIESLIRHLYVEDKSIVRRAIFMNSRSNYNSRKVQQEIKQYSKCGYSSVTVIYCIDTDHYETDVTQKNELNDIVQYCRSGEFELVWFCHDIEEVMWGRSVSEKEKVALATKFVKSNQYEHIDQEKLRQDRYQKGNSNLVDVLNKYYKPKAKVKFDRYPNKKRS